MMNYIKNFQNITKDDVPTAGGKGANLGEMIRAGIPVPEGAVLLTEAYRRYTEENRIDLMEDTETIKAQYENGTMPKDIREEVLEFYRTLGEQARVAVRSSATAEDLVDASFAGQQETFLNIRGEEELIQAVKKCYASLWGKRAVSYRREKGYDKPDTALAVVIQKMVNSEIAGVLFTMNPANGNREEVLINASYGLGESVVSGAVSPDELVCDRNGSVISSVVGQKATQVIYAETQTETVEVALEKRNQLSINENQIKRLVEKSLEIEAHYGMPMDIEWAFAEDRLYILQARAVTTGADNTAGEIREDAMPPIMPVKRKMRQTLMFMLEKEPFAYYPLDFDFAMILGGQKQVIFAEAGVEMDSNCRMNEDGFMLLPSVKFKMNRNIFRMGAIMKGMKNHLNNLQVMKACLAEVEPKIHEAAERDETALTLEECKDYLEELHELLTYTAYTRFRYAVFPAFGMNRKFGKYLKKVDETLSAYNLLIGLNYKTAELNRSIRQLARQLKEKKEVKNAILAGDTYAQLTTAYPEIKPQLEVFLSQNGYKSDFPDYCFTAKTWLEDKDRFLQVLRPLLLADGTEEELSEEAGMREYQELVKKMTAGLSEKKATDLKVMIENYRKYHVLRERTQYLCEECFYACRKILKRMTVLFHMSQEELLCMRYSELQTMLKRGFANAEEQKLIERRLSLHPTAEEYWKLQQWEACKGNSETLRGISGSTGRAEGKVCIVTSPAEFHKLNKGDILVCRYTDPEWTPLFSLAAAVVADTGGVLSHAAIVAREYKIPAVLAVGNATAVLKDGDRVFVDGSAGEIERV